jgi:hypothetical protein
MVAGGRVLYGERPYFTGVEPLSGCVAGEGVRGAGVVGEGRQGGYSVCVEESFFGYGRGPEEFVRGVR